ncbi:unnamed protein product [Ixodes persulcatus]
MKLILVNRSNQSGTVNSTFSMLVCGCSIFEPLAAV